MSGPLVSLIMPCYEQEAYIGDALRSAMAQTYRPLEILICDDNSTDRTFAIIERELSAARCPHPITAHRNDRRLGIENYNVLMEKAKGAFIVHAHGDDLSFPERVARLVEHWQRTGVSLVSSNAIVIDESSRRLGLWFDPQREFDCSLERLVRIGGCPTMVGAALAYEREVFDKFGPFDRRRSPIRTDVILPFRAGLLKGHSVVAEPLLKFRTHESPTRRLLRRSDLADGPAWEEARTAEALGQFLYMLDALGRARALDRQNPRLEAVNLALRKAIVARAQRWSMARNQLISDGWRCEWTKADHDARTR